MSTASFFVSANLARNSVTMRFLELLLSAAAVTSVLATPADAPTTATKQKRKSKFQFVGVNESGAEFGNKNLPGRLDKDYTWPVHSAIDVRNSET